MDEAMANMYQGMATKVRKQYGKFKFDMEYVKIDNICIFTNNDLIFSKAEVSSRKEQN